MRLHASNRRAAWLKAAVMVPALAVTLGAARVLADTIIVQPDAESILLVLPADASGGTLIVELDGYDVTAVAMRSDDELQLPTGSLDLAAGEHALRILSADEHGDINTLLEHVLDVQAASHSSRRRWNLLLESAHRIAEDPAEDPAEDFEGARNDNQRGLLEFDAHRHASGRGLRAAGGVVYDDARETTPDQALWQSPAYELQASRTFDHGAASVTLGDDAIALGNLLFNGYTRRGLRADASALGERLQAQVFTLYSDPRTRIDEDVLPSHEQERAIGGYTMLSPLPRHPQWLRVTAGYVDGEGTLSGAAVNTLDPDTIYGGQAWNAAIDSWTLGNSLWVHAEYASAQFDSDGIGQGAAAGSDEAQQFVVQLGSGGNLAVPILDEWVLGWQHQVVGPGFFSLGNLMLPGDLNLDQGYVRLGWRGLQIGADTVSQHSDVDDDPLRPRHDSTRRSVYTSYTPLHIDPQSGPWRLLGTPTLSAEFEQVEFEQPDSDALIAGFDLDSSQRTSTLGLDLSGSSLSVSVRYSEIRFDDRSQALIVDDFPIYQPLGDTRERTTTVQLAWNPSARFMLAPQFQRSRLSTAGAASAGSNDLWGLQCQAELVPETLWLQASYSEARDRPISVDPTAPQDPFTTGGGAANFVYRMRGAQGAWPAIDWQLGGQYASSDLQDSWQLHLGFELGWSGGTE